MNNLQVQLAQSQEALRLSELEKQQGRDSLAELETRCRNLHFTFSQAQLARRDLTTKLQIVLAQKAEMRTLIDVQEASKANSERQVSETWRTIERLTEIIHGLRNHLDGHKLSQDERAIDVAGVLLEKERFQSQIWNLEHFLADHQTITEAATRRLAKQLITCKDVVRSKDEKIVELERACARMKQDMRRPLRWSPKQVAET